MTGLPQGWASVAVRDVIEDYDTIDPQRTPDQRFAYVDIGAIDNSVQKITDPKDFLGKDAPSRARRVIRTGDVLFSTVRTYLTNVAQVPPELDGQLTSTGICVLRANAATDPNYLFRWACSTDFINEISQAQDGTMYPAVRDEDVLAGPIPLPPLLEQRRIVRRLEILSARSTTARTHLAAIEKLVERYKLAVLRSAFFVDASGTLNEEEAAACGWDVRRLGQSLENLDNRRIPIKAEDRKKRQGPYDYYGASGVIDKIDEYLFDGRYLLIGEDGANLVARSSPIAFIAEGKFWVNNHAHVLGETHDACLDWVRLYFAAIKLEPFVTGSAQPKLTQANLNKIPVPLPTPEEQREIVRRIETAFAKIERLKAEAAKALKLLGHLDQRILAKAFAGDLVPQDPNDEPAETLLARIRETKAAAPKSRRGRK